MQFRALAERSQRVLVDFPGLLSASFCFRWAFLSSEVLTRNGEKVAWLPGTWLWPGQLLEFAGVAG